MVMKLKKDKTSTSPFSEPEQQVEKTPIENLLDKITKSLHIIRQDYMGNRTPKFLN
jgi:hypothetical protein